MILINPMSGSNKVFISANGLKDYDVNYTFASYLSKYLQAKGDKVMLTRSTSEARTDIELTRLYTNAAPDIVFHIKCLSDLGSTVKGYTVECDQYTALAATVSAELLKWGAASVYPIGYKILSGLSSYSEEPVRGTSVAKYTEITIGLGYLTNPEDVARLGDNSKLEALARTMVTAAYGPPTKVMQPKDDVYTPDPYLYDASKWTEQAQTKLADDVGAIVDDTNAGIPIKLLRLSAKSAHTTPYTWSTPFTLPDAVKKYVAIVSVRGATVGSKGYIKVGSTVQEPSYPDTNWHTVSFDYIDGDAVYLGVSSGTLEYTAVWVTPKGELGNLDDPLKQYSIYPPGYRPDTVIDSTALKAAASSTDVITRANTLIGRALDTSQIKASDVLQAALSKVDQLAISPKALTSSLQGIMGQISSQAQSLTNISKLDPSKVLKGINYSGMEGMLKNMARNDKRAALQKAVNDMKSTEQAAKKQLASLADKTKKAKEQAELIKKRMEAKGEAMIKP